MPGEMKRWCIVPIALVSAATAVLALVTMAGGYAATYDPVQPDGTIDNAPVRALGFFLLGLPPTVAIAFVGYLVIFALNPPVTAFSWQHFKWAAGIATACTALLAISAHDSFSHGFEFIYIGILVPVLVVALEAGFVVGGAVGQGITRRSTRTRAKAARAG